MTELSKSEKEIYDLRREKVEKLKRTESFPTYYKNTSFISDIHANHQSLDNGEQTDISVAVRGRVLSIRSFGKLTFIDVKDSTGKIQLLASKDDLDEKLEEHIELMDVGDIVGTSGSIMKTKKGELSLKISNLIVLSKSLRTLPEKWHGLKDKETRFRQRYLDLIVNDDAKKTIDTRFKVLKLIREFMVSDGFIEVETPTLQPKAGGAIAKPFVTHHNAMSIDMFLRIAPELYLKRLVVGGFEKVFEIARVFRNEGLSTRHNPEFTMLELYEAYADWDDIMELAENLIEFLAVELTGSSTVSYDGKEIDLSTPWRRASMIDLIREQTGNEVSLETPINELRQLCSQHDIEIHSAYGPGKLILELYEKTVEPNIWNPCFVTEYPKEVSPLSRDHRSKPGFTERFEGIVAGREILNGFSELVDSEEQMERFEDQVEKSKSGDEEAMGIDIDYVRALEFGLPPTGGIGIGIDRLVMMLADVQTIRSVFEDRCLPLHSSASSDISIILSWGAAKTTTSTLSPNAVKGFLKLCVASLVTFFIPSPRPSTSPIL